MKNSIIALIFLILTSCNQNQKLDEPVNMESADNDVSVKVSFNEVDKHSHTYFGEMELKNNRTENITYPNWKLRICVRNNENAHLVSIDEAAPNRKNAIDNDMETVIKPNGDFSHKVMVTLNKDEKIEDFHLVIVNDLHKTDAEFSADFVGKCE